MANREKNNSGTLVGSPYGMMNGGIIRESLQYGWSRGLVNMQIQEGFDFSGWMQIEVTLGNGPRKAGREVIQ